MTFRFAKIGLVAAALSVFGQARADGGNFYVGGGLGAGGINVDCSGTNKCDRVDVGGKLYGGYKLTNGLAFEGSYINYGKAKRTTDGSPTDNVKVDGFGVGIAMFGDVDQLNFSGRLGFATNRGKDDLMHASSSKTKLTAGVGVGFALTSQLSLQAAFDLSEANWGNNENGTVHLITVGAAYQF